MIDIGLWNSGASTRRLLCLGAHSDDVEIGCGGTVMAILEQNENIAVRWIVFSANDERMREAHRSADSFLAKARHREVVVKRYRDGFLPFQGAEIKDEFESLKRDFDPDLILTHFRDDRHQDHRLVSDLTWNTFRDHLILEYEIPKYDGDLGQPNFFVPLTEAICDRKIRIIIESFKTQQQKAWFDEPTFRAILRLRGMEANSPTRFAEAFYCRKAVLGGLG